MKALRNWKLVFVCAAIVGLLCGCSAIGLNVETQLTPPDSSVEQNAIRKALDEYIQGNTAPDESVEYTLKYPSSGQYLSAFIMLNQVQEHNLLNPAATTADGAPVNTMALAFYRRNDADALVHINLLQRTEENVWVSVADVEGKGQSVNQVEFADLNNDDIPELLIGWQLYNTRDSLLAIYDIDDNLKPREFSQAYTKLIVSDITADGCDDIVLLSLASGLTPAKAEVFSFQTDNIIVHGETPLDYNIVKFGNHIAAPLTPDSNGIFVDCYKEQDAMITELICWRDRELVAPLCNEDTLLNTLTARETPLASRDIDGDGVVEWPVTTRMPGFEDTDIRNTLWRAEWRSYDAKTETIVTKFTALIPPERDGYMLRLRETWETLPVAYNSATRTLTMYHDAEGGEWLFRIGVFTPEERDALPEGFAVLEETDTRCYAVCLAENATVSIEEIRYLLSLISEEASV